MADGRIWIEIFIYLFIFNQKFRKRCATRGQLQTEEFSSGGPDELNVAWGFLRWDRQGFRIRRWGV